MLHSYESAIKLGNATGVWPGLWVTPTTTNPGKTHTLGLRTMDICACKTGNINFIVWEEPNFKGRCNLLTKS